MDPALLSAALRHAKDARWLYDRCKDHVSEDQAWHLAGFAAECARKALLGAGTEFNKLLGHDFGRMDAALIDVYAAIDPSAIRHRLSEWSQEYPALKGWKPSHRYHATGRHTDRAHRRTSGREKLEEVGELVETAEKAVWESLLTAWLEGVSLKRVR